MALDCFKILERKGALDATWIWQARKAKELQRDRMKENLEGFFQWWVKS